MAFVILQSGEMKGQRFELERAETTLGRANDNVIQINSGAVSSHHLKVVRDGKKFSVVDLDSTNGTGLNGVAIKQASLKPKDIISVGGVELLFDGDDVEFAAPFADAATGPSNTIRLATFDPSTAAPPPTFGARRDTKHLWLRILIGVGVIALAILVWFMWRLFSASSSSTPAP